MSNEPSPTLGNTVETVANITESALNLRGKMSDQDQRSVLKTLITVLITYAGARFNLLDADQASQLMSEFWAEFAFIGSIPGVQAAYALWRKDR